MRHHASSPFFTYLTILFCLLALPEWIRGEEEAESVDDDSVLSVTTTLRTGELEREAEPLLSLVNAKCALAAESGTCPGNPAVNQSGSGSVNGSRYFYSITNYKCAEFPYSGCGGNANNFLSLEQCKTECDKPSPDVGKIKGARESGQCWYKNKLYKEGESIGETTEDNACSVGCLCGGGGGGKVEGLKITCAAIDCPPPPETREKCVPIYKAKTCCPSSYSCQDDVKNTPDGDKPSKTGNGTVGGAGGAVEVFKCKFEGEEYVEGQNIYPKHFPCYTCPCNRNFTGVVNTEVCSEVNCGISIHRQHELLNRCEPQYYKTDSGQDSCCPIDWTCAQSTAPTTNNNNNNNSGDTVQEEEEEE